MPSSASFSRFGCSTRHGAHQLAQKFTSFTPSARTSLSCRGVLSPNGVTSTAGATRPSIAEGSSLGFSRCNPTKANTVNPATITSGAAIKGEILAIAFRFHFNVLQLLLNALRASHTQPHKSHKQHK